MLMTLLTKLGFSPRRASGASLIELMVTLALIALFAAVAAPSCHKLIDGARFRSVQASWRSQFMLARRAAQTLETTVRLEPERDFRISYRQGPEWQPLTDSGVMGAARLGLPDEEVEHPTLGSALAEPFRSTHHPYLLFTARGSSSATVVYSDSARRALCAVISSQTGRVRLFTRDGPVWQPD